MPIIDFTLNMYVMDIQVVILEQVARAHAYPSVNLVNIDYARQACSRKNRNYCPPFPALAS